MSSWLNQYSVKPQQPQRTVAGPGTPAPGLPPSVAFVENTDFGPDGRFLHAGRFVVLITSKSCRYCEDFMPVFTAFAAKAQQLGVTPAVIERVSTPDSVDLFARIEKLFPELRGFPSVYMIENGAVVASYSGDRSLESLVTFAQYK